MGRVARGERGEAPRPGRGSRPRGAGASALLALAAASACGDPAGPVGGPPCEGPTSGALCLALVTSALEMPVGLAGAPGDGRLFVVELTGRVRVLDGDSLLPEPFLDLSRAVTVSEEEGLLALAFDPAWPERPAFYVTYVDLDGSTRLSRFRTQPDGRRGDPASEEVLLVIPRLLPFHHAGHLLFGPDGHLWLAVGDGAQAELAQDLASPRGSLLRLDVRPDGPYRVPPDNPFVGEAGARPEIWAYGLRNPWRFHLDAEGGLLWVADVGAVRREEIDVVPLDLAGANFGWPLLEGTLCAEPGCSAEGTVLPALDYPHAEGCAVIGGVVYRGSAVPALRGHYLYGDLCGFLWSLRWDGVRVLDRIEWWGKGALEGLTAVAEGPGGDVYALLLDGRVFRLEAAPTAP